MTRLGLSFAQALTIKEKSLGAQNPDLAPVLTSLAASTDAFSRLLRRG